MIVAATSLGRRLVRAVAQRSPGAVRQALVQVRGIRASTLTVVVVVTDANAFLLDACLGGLLAQTRRPDEVILAAAGSTSDTARAVRDACASTWRARVAPAQGLSEDEAARRGCAAGRGTYLLSLQAGDLLQPDALERLAAALDGSESEAATAGSPVGRDLEPAELRDVGALLDPATVLFRRRLVARDLGGVGSPDGAVRWLPTARWFLAARRISLVEGPLRQGPRRGTGAAAGSVPRLAAAVPDWISAVDTITGALALSGARDAADRLLVQVLAVDSWDYLADAERADDAAWRQLAGAAERWWSSLGAERLEEVPVEQRVAVWLAARGRRTSLEEYVVARWLEDGHFGTRVVDGRVLADLPVVDVPDEVLAVGAAETPLHARIARVTRSEHGGLHLECHAFLRRVGDQADPPVVAARLVAADGRCVETSVEVRSGPEVEVWAAERCQDHGWARVLVHVDPDRLSSEPPGRWRLELDMQTAGVRRQGVVTRVDRRGSAAVPVSAGTGTPTVTYRPESAEIVVGDIHDSSLGEPVLGDSSGQGVLLEDVVLDDDELLVRVRCLQPLERVSLVGSRGRATDPAPRRVGAVVEARVRLRHDPWGIGHGALPPGVYTARGEGVLEIGDRRRGSGARRPHALRRALGRPPRRAQPGRLRQLVLGPPLADDEAGPRAQQRAAPLVRHRRAPGSTPRRCYFQSYAGLSATDSPLAIHHELRRARPDLRLRLGGGRTPPSCVPEGAERVLLRSREWYAALASCGHIVTNIDLDEWFRKRPGQRLLQTYHGYPSKAMGVMAWEAKNFTPSLIERHLRRTSATWDLLLTPAPVDGRALPGAVPLRRADPEPPATPATTSWSGRDAARLREDTRAAARIGDRTAVLYAPTWRDDLTTNFRAAVMPSTLRRRAAAPSAG